MYRSTTPARSILTSANRRGRTVAGVTALLAAAGLTLPSTGHAVAPTGRARPAPSAPATLRGNSEAAPAGRPTESHASDANTFGHTAVAAAPTPGGRGFWVVWADGTVSTSGDASWFGDMAGKGTNAQMVGIAATADGNGYWLLGSDGGVFSFGDAHFGGSTGGMRINAPALQMATPGQGAGYDFVSGDGGIFSFGGAPFHGSTGSMHLVRPVVGMASTRDGGGYWLVAADGGIFSFGNAGFHGSTGGMALNQPIVAMAPTASGQGYWLIAADGGIFAFGDATFHGSAVGQTGGARVVGLVATADGGGYWVVVSDGRVLNFGDAAPLAGTTAPAATPQTTGAPGGYSFEVTDTSGRPARWNSCEAVHYSVVTAGAPAGWAADVAAATAQLSAATGLAMTMDGAYPSSPAVPSITKVTISWVPTLVGGDDVGLTTYYYINDSRWTPQMTSANVQLLDGLDAGGGANGELPVLLHELGHAVGLGHTPGAQVMNAIDQGLSSYQAGDLSGLDRVGASAGCAGFYS